MERKLCNYSSVISKEGKFFVSFCPELGVTSQGKTKREALDNLNEAIELYLEEDPIVSP